MTFETLITFLTIENNNLNIHSYPWIKSDRDSIRNSCDVFYIQRHPTLQYAHCALVEFRDEKDLLVLVLWFCVLSRWNTKFNSIQTASQQEVDKLSGVRSLPPALWQNSCFWSLFTYSLVGLYLPSNISLRNSLFPSYFILFHNSYLSYFGKMWKVWKIRTLHMVKASVKAKDTILKNQKSLRALRLCDPSRLRPEHGLTP